MRIKYFETKTVFKQIVERKRSGAFRIKAAIEFMVCNDQRCLPPTEKELFFDIPKSTSKKDTSPMVQININTDIQAKEHNTTDTAKEVRTARVPAKVISKSKTLPSSKGSWSIFFFSFLGGLAAFINALRFFR